MKLNQDTAQSIIKSNFGPDAVALGVEYSKKGTVVFWVYSWENDDAARAYLIGGEK